ncbi:hypothetical protein BUALT_Bualt06G0001700 [Buddleja alternifolia]|uniref:Seipin n=1 Tax=Buddleja alternifolia TaxID=168488 RepID=A0AAV6XCW8_9LAMI|nr:hypothetical protein BUALT_Bualt06G0001700 [Buddleja alternifolia]
MEMEYSNYDYDDDQYLNHNNDDDDDDRRQQLPAIFPYKPPFIIKYICAKLISLQPYIISNTTSTILNLIPFFSIKSLLSNFFFFQYPNKQEDEDDHYFQQPPSGGGGSLLLGRIFMGLLAAAYVCMVLIIVMIVAAVLGVGLVRMWAEEPIYVRESLQFDYADAHPTAVFYAASAAGVPVGQTLYVSFLLLMPESDYNRDIGIFQLRAELISSGGDLIVKSSHPCMLHFRSWPIRLVRTFMMGIPLLLGITTETQRLTFPILKHKEVSYPRTEHIRITLIPRAGTSYLPQFYDAEIVVKSRLPWIKELVYRWKWTLYVWTTLYMFIMLVMVLVVFLKPLIFPVMIKYNEQESSGVELESSREALTGDGVREERQVSETLRRWQKNRSERKAALLHGVSSEFDGSSASSITVDRGESGACFQEGSGDSESVRFEGFDG